MRQVYDTLFCETVFYHDLADNLAWYGTSDPKSQCKEIHSHTGEIILRTGFYQWTDGTIRDYPEE